MIYEITDVSKIEPLFGDWKLPLFQNYAKKPELKYFITDPDAPRSAMLLFDDFEARLYHLDHVAVLILDIHRDRAGILHVQRGGV